jgi:hypothetical protein
MSDVNGLFRIVTALRSEAKQFEELPSVEMPLTLAVLFCLAFF